MENGKEVNNVERIQNVYNCIREIAIVKEASGNRGEINTLNAVEATVLLNGNKEKCTLTGSVDSNWIIKNNDMKKPLIEIKVDATIKLTNGSEYKVQAKYSYVDNNASGITPVINFDYFGISGKFYKPESLTAAINTILIHL